MRTRQTLTPPKKAAGPKKHARNSKNWQRFSLMSILDFLLFSFSCCLCVVSPFLLALFLSLLSFLLFCFVCLLFCVLLCHLFRKHSSPYSLPFTPPTVAAHPPLSLPPFTPSNSNTKVCFVSNAVFFFFCESKAIVKRKKTASQEKEGMSWMSGV